ncbi:hypothetical protein C3L33_01112, partial [Rhododendron williamsianum]
MVNLVAAQRPMLIGLMKMAGVVPHTVEIEPGTSMNFWVPNETINTKPKKSKEKPKQNKPVVVLVHGFAAEGIVTWQFQIGSLTKKYAVYVPDLLFFGGELGEKTTFEGIKKAGHLVHLERPCAYNRCLKRFLASLHAAHEAQN